MSTPEGVTLKVATTIPSTMQANVACECTIDLTYEGVWPFKDDRDSTFIYLMMATSLGDLDDGGNDCLTLFKTGKTNGPLRFTVTPNGSVPQGTVLAKIVNQAGWTMGCLRYKIEVVPVPAPLVPYAVAS